MCHHDASYVQVRDMILILSSDIRAKAKRWDQKHVDALKRRRDQYLNEIKELTKDRRKEGDLAVMKSQLDGLETRLKFAKKDKETTVCISRYSLR